MSKRRRPAEEKRHAKATRLMQEARNRPPLIVLTALDASLFDDDGIALHLGARKDGQRLMENILEETEHGKSFRQALLDRGNQLLGTPKVDLAQAVPALVEPSGMSEPSLLSFHEAILDGMRRGHALLLGEVENLLVLETYLCPLDGPVPEGFRVVSGVIPGRYALLVPKDERLRRAVRASEEEFKLAMVIDIGGVGDRAKALDHGKDAEEEEERLQEALAHLEAHLAVKSGELWEIFGSHLDCDDEDDE